VAAWARDLPLRQPAPSDDEAAQAMNVTLAKAALPLGREAQSLLRIDPFGSYEQLLGHLQTQRAIALEVRDDYLFEPSSGRTLIPMLLAHDPLQSDQTTRVEEVVSRACQTAGACERVGFVGGHFATLENKRQVMEDMSTVSVSGVLCLLLALAGLAWLRQLRLLLVLPPILLGTLLAAAAIILKDGWIHGITLSFGTALIGLCGDHGVHAAFHARTPAVWRSNLMALLTTLIVLVVVSFSSIPVLRQLMQFAILGLVLSFTSLFVFQRGLPQLLDAAPLRLPAFRSRLIAWTMGGLALLGLLGFRPDSYDLDLQKLSYTSERTLELYKWFRKAANVDSLFLVELRSGEAPVLERLHAAHAWASAQKIRHESAAAYLPPLPEQESSRQRWFTQDCRFRFDGALDETQRRFFAPYLAPDPCKLVLSHDLQSGEPPAYLRHLASKEGWMSIFFPASPAEAAAVRERFPAAFSLADVASRFPRLLKGEMTWMAPSALGILGAMLIAYFRRPRFVIAALLPFFAGIGAVVAAALATRQPLNFVTMIGLLLLCGVSVDYGIFAVDQWRQRNSHPERVRSALILCFLSALLGALPMTASAHPVLQSLGIPLSLGLTAAIVTTFYTVPRFLDWRAKTDLA
jgi:predicted exporter